MEKVESLGVARRSKLARDLTPRFPIHPGKAYIPHKPHAPQQAFLLLSWLPEVFYGGAAGGGKSDAGLMGALQYVDVPGFSALIIRRTFQDLALPGAIMDRAGDWLRGTVARKRDQGKRWEFPTAGRPATIQFGYAQRHQDITRYQGAEFQYVFVDELTHFEERTYTYLFSRLRGPAVPCAHCGHGTSQPAGKRRTHDEDHDHCFCGHEHDPRAVCDDLGDEGVCGCDDYRPTGCECTAPEPDRAAVGADGLPLLVPAPDGTTLADVPLRMRSGSNPGGVGHEWVRARFVDPETKLANAVFVPARIEDNPSLDRRAYRESLSHLSPVEILRLEKGDWEVGEDGDLFERHWFRIVDVCPRSDVKWCRFWDRAATVQDVKKRNDPDWTVGALVGLDKDGLWWIKDIVRKRGTPLEIDQLIQHTAATDGRGVMQRQEQEPGSSGVAATDHFRRVLLPGYDADGIRPTLSKEERARPVAKTAEVGNVRILSAPWNRTFLDEVAAFPNPGMHDDQVDAVAGCWEALAGPRRARIIA